ncbi:MAG: hypothetical protein FD167_2544 [bacterium]|nr:MAG: hypothetical protein FD167_2544 [bacterium]
MSKSIEPDQKERTRLDKLNQSVKRKQGFSRVADAVKTSFNTRHEMTDYLGLCSTEDLNLAIKVGFAVEVESRIYLTGKEVIREDYLDLWLDLETLELLDKPRKKVLIAKEDEKGKQNVIPPTLPGCKCRNTDQVDKHYWLFTGWQVDGILEVAKYLESIGVKIFLQPNGTNGNYQLNVPLYVKGEVVIGAQSRWKDKEEEESYVINSIASSTETSFEAGRECIY